MAGMLAVSIPPSWLKMRGTRSWVVKPARSALGKADKQFEYQRGLREPDPNQPRPVHLLCCTAEGRAGRRANSTLGHIRGSYHSDTISKPTSQARTRTTELPPRTALSRKMPQCNSDFATCCRLLCVPWKQMRSGQRE